MPDVLLVIDREQALFTEVRDAVASTDAHVIRAATAEQAFRALDSGWVDLVLCTPETEGADGYDIVPQLRRRLPQVAVAFASDATPAELSQHAITRGVVETLARPIDAAAMRLVLHRAQESQRLRRDNGLLRREVRRELGERPIVAASSRMIEVLEAVEVASGLTTPTLLRGEPGTGKEAIARAIHVQSPRHDAPFVSLSCAAANESHVESELFGRTRGSQNDGAPARRGLLVEARGGTLYLDEIGALSRRMQERLATTIEARELEIPDEDRTVTIDVQILASTQRDLVREAKSGRFDDDLIGLFNPEPIEVPALRERREDIPLLADAMLARLSLRHGRETRGIAEPALDALTRHAWPGNVRELENALERAILVADGERVELRDLPDPIQQSHSEGGEDVWALRPAKRAAETAAIRRALRATGGNRTHAARLLRISQRALLYKLKDYDIKD